ncbi:hypothetical protein ACI782_00340 [Geodermatophilus sp. SYSU D00703]
MTSGGVVVLLILIGLVALSVTTLVVAVRGGRGPADPPASHARTDPAGFPVLPEPRGVLPRHPAQPRPSRGPAGRGAGLAATLRGGPRPRRAPAPLPGAGSGATRSW